jgi:protein involved in polysaccharide export with SLBB domain
MKTDRNHLLPRRRGESCRQRGCFAAAVFGVARLWALAVLLAGGRLAASDAPIAKAAGTTQPSTNGVTGTAAAPSEAASNAAAVDASGGMNLLDDKHQLASGDQISVRIVEDEEEPKALTVTDSGQLEVPYIGRFQAVGKTCKQLAGQLKAALEKEYYYRATVIIAVNVMAKSRGRVYLVGPVHLPGPQEIPSDEVLTLSKAILRAGGFTDFADKKDVKVTRQAKVAGGKDETFTINVGKVLEKGTTESDLPLEPGDLIYVPEKLVRF